MVSRLLLIAAIMMLAACQSTREPPLPVVSHVDLPRFMGDWYVIAATPTFLDRDAYNAVESYRLEADGTIATTYTFRPGSFDASPKRYTPRGFVLDRTSNAIWGMQFVWPIKADYRIVYLASDYSQTVIARERRDYVWIMARTPHIPHAEYERLFEFVVAMGYDPAHVRRIPQRWENHTRVGEEAL
jgi:apolipoprotein D and lipocalin family protein